MMKLLAALLLCVLLAVAPASGVIRTRIERPPREPYLARNPFTRALVMRTQKILHLVVIGQDRLNCREKNLMATKQKKPPNFSHVFHKKRKRKKTQQFYTFYHANHLFLATFYGAISSNHIKLAI